MVCITYDDHLIVMLCLIVLKFVDNGDEDGRKKTMRERSFK